MNFKLAASSTVALLLMLSATLLNLRYDYQVEKEVSPHINTKELAVKPPVDVKRTAILWTALGIVSKCEADRLHHLVSTTNMDVWVMHSHRVLNKKGKQEDLKRSQAAIDSILGVQQWAQKETPFYPLDGNSGATKSSSMAFLVEHPQYDYAWIVENDVFYTGRWDAFFESPEILHDTTDYLTAFEWSPNPKEWWWTKEQKCLVLGERCDSQANLKAMPWFFARVSARLARDMWRDLTNGQIVAHHEAVIVPYCQKKKCSYGVYNTTKHNGVMLPGHMGLENTELDVAFYENYEDKELERNKLVHPVKCDAYEDKKSTNYRKEWTMQRDIEKWTRSEQPSPTLAE